MSGMQRVAGLSKDIGIAGGRYAVAGAEAAGTAVVLEDRSDMSQHSMVACWKADGCRVHLTMGPDRQTHRQIDRQTDRQAVTCTLLKLSTYHTIAGTHHSPVTCDLIAAVPSSIV